MAFNFNRQNDVPTFLEQLSKIFKQQKEENVKLREQLNNFKAQVYKDEELVKMKNTYDRMKEDYYRGFPIQESEMKDIKEWRKNHEDKFHGGYPCYHGASGGGYEYVFSPTSIGTAQTCYCSSCRRKAIVESKGDLTKQRELLKKYNAYFDFSGDW